MTTTAMSTISPKAQMVKSFKNVLEGKYYQEQLKQVLKENAGTFATSLMEVVTGDDKLLACNPRQLMAEAVKAASLKLPLNKQLGYAYLLPFNITNKQTGKKESQATLVIGYKGYIQLAMRSGQYRNLNADIVYEGELVSKDKITGAIDLSGEKKSNKVVGYFAYFELLNGFNKLLFISVEEMAHYCKTYSPTIKWDKITEKQLIELAQTQAENGVTGGTVGWKGDFNSMAIKTCLRRLLSKYGILSIEMMNAMSDDEVPSSEEVRNEDNAAPKEEIDAKAILQEAQAEEVKEDDLGELE